MADLQCVSRAGRLRPGRRELMGEGDQGLVALLVGPGAGPDPLYAQGGFADAFALGSVAFLGGDAGAGDRNRGQGLGAEFERHPGGDGNTADAGIPDADVGVFRHVKPLAGCWNRCKGRCPYTSSPPIFFIPAIRCPGSDSARFGRCHCTPGRAGAPPRRRSTRRKTRRRVCPPLRGSPCRHRHAG